MKRTRTTKRPHFTGGINIAMLDRVDNYVQSSVWLELHAANVERAVAYLKTRGVTVCDEVEPLPADFAGQWISNPAGVVHLVCNQLET